MEKLIDMEDTVSACIVDVDTFHHPEKILIVHSYINQKGKMLLNKAEAALLLIELYKFINDY